MDSEHAASQQDFRSTIIHSARDLGWRQRLWKVFQKQYEFFLIPVSLVLFVAGWRLIIDLGDYPEFILPQPLVVWNQFLLTLSSGELWFHARFTLIEALSGFTIGLVFATLLGYILGRRPGLEKVISPYIVAAKSIPILGIAPLIIIWFGQGIISKALIAFLIIFFPMLVNTIVGIRTVNEDQRELMRSYSASSWQVFTLLEVPSALPLLLGGMKVGLARSMMGAIVGEYLGSKQGLGFLVNMGTGGGMASAPLTFVGIFAIVAITLVLYGLATVLENVLLFKRPQETI